MELDKAWGITNYDRLKCQEKFDALRFEGIYTPPSLEGTLFFPGNIGGSNWGGVAVDPERQIVIANVSNLAFAVTLIPRDDFEAARKARPDAEHAPQRGTPYGLRREPLISPFGILIPCF